MSILLSAYYPEGIVFVADKNITNKVITPTETKKYVEPTGVKVLSWPNRRAIVGYTGLGTLSKDSFEEWLRLFIAETRDFKNFKILAKKLRDRIQDNFSEEFQFQEVYDKQLLIHLGGFTKKEGVYVPVKYFIRNCNDPIDPKTGAYPPGERIFYVSEEVEANFKGWPNPEDYPKRVRDRLQNMINERRFYWFNNGYNIGAFNVFKAVVWQALNVIRDAGFAPNSSGIDARVAFCRMSVELFGSYFTYHNLPEDRVVGGGSDAVYIPWPE